MSRVFVVNYGGHDLSDAYRFTSGRDKDIVYLTTGNVNVFNTDRIITEIIRKLEDFEENDFLLFCGYAILSSIAMAHLLQRFHAVKILLFNAKKREYIVRHITRKEIEGVFQTGEDQEGE